MSPITGKAIDNAARKLGRMRSKHLIQLLESNALSSEEIEAMLASMNARKVRKIYRSLPPCIAAQLQELRPAVEWVCLQTLDREAQVEYVRSVPFADLMVYFFSHDNKPKMDGEIAIDPTQPITFYKNPREKVLVVQYLAPWQILQLTQAVAYLYEKQDPENEQEALTRLRYRWILYQLSTEALEELLREGLYPEDRSGKPSYRRPMGRISHVALLNTLAGALGGPHVIRLLLHLIHTATDALIESLLVSNAPLDLPFYPFSQVQVEHIKANCLIYPRKK